MPMVLAPPVGGALSFAKIMPGLERPAALGFSGDMCVLVNSASWQDINEDQAALRQYTSSGKAGGTKEELKSKVLSIYPGATFEDGITGTCNECGEHHFKLETDCKECGGIVEEE